MCVDQRTLRDAQEILDKYGPKPEFTDLATLPTVGADSGDGAAGADATPTTPAQPSVLATLTVVNDEVLARAQKIAYLLS